MIEVTIVIQIDGNGDDPSEIAQEVRDNLQDTLGHSPYGATIVLCSGEEVAEEE